MSKLEATLKKELANYDYYIVDTYDFVFNNAKISFINSNDSFKIIIEDNEVTEDNCKEIFYDIIEIINLSIGYFPKEITSELNSNVITLYEVSKYFTDDYYTNDKAYRCLEDINIKSINENTIQKIRDFKKLNKSLASLNCLFSDAYKNIYNEHKLVLLLHVIDGIVDKKEAKLYTRKLLTVKSNHSLLDSDFKPKIYLLWNKYISSSDFQFNTDINLVLGTSNYNAANTLGDTRHWYSHYLNVSKKVNRLCSGEDFLLYIELIYLLVRLRILENIGVAVDNMKLKDVLNIFYDWIVKVKEMNKPLKSQVYKQMQMLEKIDEQIKLYTKP